MAFVERFTINSATAFLNDLMIVLDNVAKRDIDPLNEDEFPILGFDYWSGECAKLLI
jgi:hypothetical protein